MADIYIASLEGIALPDLETSGASRYLTIAQRRRYSRLKSAQARKQFLAARYLARAVVAESLGTEPRRVELAQRCPSCSSSEHGRPLPEGGLSVSWSHANAAVAVAVSSSDIGVDVEAADALREAPAELESLLCTTDEVASLPADQNQRRLDLARLWTVKEALIKVGEGSLDELRHIRVGTAHAAERMWPGRRRLWRLTRIECLDMLCAVASIPPVRVHVVTSEQFAAWRSFPLP